jgi:pimeloyl-ACP methyl ester carboxylesterase
MANEKSGYVNVNGGKVYYEIGGSGETLVLNHAGFVDSGMWDAQWEAFTQHFRVLRYDMRGYGKADRVNAPLCRRDDLYQLLRQLDVQQAHLLGCSMGGEIVIDFTLDHPEMVKSLVAVSATPSGFELQGEPPPHLMEMMEAAQQGDFERTSELQIRIWVDGMYRQPEQVDPQVRKQAAAMNLISVKNQTWAAQGEPLHPLDPPAMKRLGDMRVPTLLITGALDHPEIGRAADVMQKSIANAKHISIADTAHVPNMEQPAVFNRAVLEFLS